MKRFESLVNPSSPEFTANFVHNASLAKILRERIEKWSKQGSDQSIVRARKTSKMLGRERLSLLLDEDSHFLEIGALAGWDQPDQKLEGNPMIGGIGLVCGIEVMIVTNVPTIGGGAMTKISSTKWQRCSDISIQNRLPFVQLLESSGLDLDKAFEGFHIDPNWFHRLANRSALGIPTVTVVFGTCIAGGAYMAGMSDYVIMVKGQGQLALAGSKLVKTATGENATDEELGGAEMHSRISGASDYLAQSETDAISKARSVIASFNVVPKHSFAADSPSTASSGFDLPFPEPFYDPEELFGAVSADPKQTYDVRDVIARIVDSSRFTEFKPDYGSTIVTVFANIFGNPVGIIGNNGVIFPQTAQKGAHFINLCNQRGIPIIFLHNVTGFIVGKAYEAAGMIKWGSLMVNAVANSVVPKISILIGGSFGAANFAMCGKGYEPRFIFSWPNAKCAVMGPDQLAGVMTLLAEERAQRAGMKVMTPEVQAQLDQVLTKYKSRIENEMDAFYCSSRYVDDGVIDPRNTRAVLGICLSVVRNKPIEAGFIRGVSRL